MSCLTSRKPICSAITILLLLLCQCHGGLSSQDYELALTKSILYFEAQRSGPLPANQRVKWRGDSALNDGSDVGVDLVGGYSDAGDNVKFGLPLAFTITMLSWGVVEYNVELKDELNNALDAIKWGTDYLIKAHSSPNVLYAQVGEGKADHECWQRPEDMTTPRTAYKIDDEHPGADLAGETSAAFAAASMAFKHSNNPQYSSSLLTHARQLFEFGKAKSGKYTDYIPANDFYASSGFYDEMAWAAAWLYRATGEGMYFDYLQSAPGGTGDERSTFSWDDKYVGVQILASKIVLDGSHANQGIWSGYKDQGEAFICNILGKGRNNIQRTGAGLTWFDEFNNLQYVTSASFIVTVYADYLEHAGASMSCNGGDVQPAEMRSFVKSQVDYILGSNPESMSYMIGYGDNYPKQVHHRAASIVSFKDDPTPVTCPGGFDWYHKEAPNPNVIDGAIVGGPNQSDIYNDVRSNYKQAEPATANIAPIVGVLARLNDLNNKNQLH